MKQTLNKQQLAKVINSIVIEGRSGYMPRRDPVRSQINNREIESNIDDLSDLDTDLPGEVSPFDEPEEATEHDPWRSGSGLDNEEDFQDEPDEADFYAGLEDNQVDHDEEFDLNDLGIEDDYTAQSDALERIGGHEMFEHTVLRRIIKNIIKEDIGNLAPTPNAEPCKSNGNGVESVIARKGNLKKDLDENRLDPETGRSSSGVQSQMLAKHGEEGLDMPWASKAQDNQAGRIAAMKKRAAMKKAAGMQTLEEILNEIEEDEDKEEKNLSVNQKDSDGKYIQRAPWARNAKENDDRRAADQKRREKNHKPVYDTHTYGKEHLD